MDTTLTQRVVPHPAKYTKVLLPVFADILKRYDVNSVLDPMAGTGRIGDLKELGFEGRIVANELEPEWAKQAPDCVEVHIGDAARMKWAADDEFDAICVSPVYGSRMSDSHNANDGSRRYTYTHQLGRKLHEDNTGKMQWGEAYRHKHQKIWSECQRVVRPGGIFIINVKNHIRKGQLVQVSEWHAEVFLTSLHSTLLERHQIACPGMRNGANNKLRVEYEDVWVFSNGDLSR